MGYHSTMRGEIAFDPPLLHADLAAVPADGEALFVLKIDELHRDTADGVLVSRSSRRIVPLYTEEVRAYELEEAIGALLFAIGTRGPRVYTGEIRVEGERVGDCRRLLGAGATVEVQSARLVWPDGSEVA